MPEPSFKPLVLAGALLIFFTAMLLAAYPIAAVAVVVAATMAAWLWPPRLPGEEAEVSA